MIAERLRLARRVRTRLRPLAALVAVLISLGLPVTYYALGFAGRCRDAAGHAREVSTSLATRSFEATRDDVLPGRDITAIRVLDADGRALVGYSYGASGTPWWETHSPSGRAAATSRRGEPWMVEVTVSQTGLLRTTAGLLALSVTVGLGLGSLVYVYPSRVIGRIERQVDDMLAREKSLVEASRLLAGSLDLREVLDRLTEIARTLPGIDVVRIWLVDEARGDLVLHSQAGVRRADVAHEVRLDRTRGLTGAVIEAGRPVVIRDTVADPRLVNAEWIRLEGIVSFLGVPLRVGETLVGALACMSRATRDWSAAEVAFAETLGSLAAVAIKNARLFAGAQQAYGELATTQAQLVRGETLRAMGELASGVAHHLNNLLAVVLGRLQLARSRLPTPPIDRHLELAERAALDGADVVRRMRGFSRGQPVADLEPVDLNRVAHEVIELTRPRWQDEAQVRGITITTELEAGAIPPVAGEHAALREVLMNLIMNAIDALPSGGAIVVRTSATADRVVCEVADTGVGMSPDVQRRAPEPFFTTKGFQSTGLGLAVTYGIVRRHGGDLAIESSPGNGTRVRFMVPVTTVCPDPTPAPTPAVTGPLRILVIDDEAAVRTVVTEILAAQGHEVLHAAGGAEGLAYLDRGVDVDLVLTDLGMPGMTGWEVARGVKARRPAVRVGLLTGWGEAPTAKEEDRAAADFVIAKPVTMDALHSALASLSVRR